MSSDLTSILYDHYKDTCSIVSKAVGRRDRAMLFTIATTGFFAFQTIFPGAADVLVSELIKSKFDQAFKIDLSIIGNVVWVLILLFALRYFQTAAFVERQYDYLHQLEDKLNQVVGEEVVTREGKAYLAKYPMFADWMWALYTIILPLLLLFVTTAKIIGEWLGVAEAGFSFGLAFDTFVFLLLGISILLYLAMLHLKGKKAT